MLMTVADAERRRALGIEVRVLVNGADVTRWCMSADDAQGWALLLMVGPDGRPRVRWHQGKQVVDAMPVLGRVERVIRLYRPDQVAPDELPVRH